MNRDAAVHRMPDRRTRHRRMAGPQGGRGALSGGWPWMERPRGRTRTGAGQPPPGLSVMAVTRTVCPCMQNDISTGSASIETQAPGVKP